MVFLKESTIQFFINGAPIGDLDGDGSNEIVVYTWTGNIFVWDTPGKTTKGEWSQFYHDERHTGCYGDLCNICFGDLNGDNKVDILDIAIVAKAFKSQPRDANWNSRSDIDNNGVINIIDISKVAKQFGKTC